jgi:TolB protein
MKIYVKHIVMAVVSTFVAGCQGLQMPESPLLATFERKTGHIVYVGIDSNIYTMNQAGQDVVMITDRSVLEGKISNDTTYFYPAWSPNGEKLAFVGYRRGNDRSVEASLYTAKYDGKEFTRVFSEPGKQPFYVYWLPDNGDISLLSGTTGDDRFVMDIVSVDGSGSQEISRGIPFYWAWAPDGDVLIAHKSSRPGTELGSTSLSIVKVGDTVIDTSLDIRPSLFQSPAFSPDGKYFVAGIQNSAGGGKLVLVEEPGDRRQILDDIEGQAAFDWSPDGDRIAYMSGSPTVYGMVGELTLIDLADIDNPVVSDTNASGVIAFFWDNSGDKLAYFSIGETGISDGVTQEFVLDLSVLDVDSGEVTSLITRLRPTDAFMTQIVPHFDQYQRSSTIWSPNDRYLVINSMTEDNRPGIFVIDATGNLQPRLANYGVMPFWSRK